MKRLVVAAAALLLGFTSAKADISRIVVGFPAGQATDIVARLIAERIGPILGETFIVENRPGQGGSIALAQLAKTQADGRTLVLAPLASLVANPHLYKSVGYDTPRDFTPVTLVCDFPILFVVNPKLPVKNVAELIAYAKSNPVKLSYGTPGVGTPQHVAGELFANLAGIRMEHIPYRGANLSDLMSGVVQVGIQNAGASLPLVRDGRVRGIGITSLERSPNAPDLPTFNESGFPGFEATSWFALMGPAGLPKPIVDKVRAESLKVLADPEMKQKFAALGLDTVGSTPEETRAAIAGDIPKWAKVIKEANIKTGN